MRAINRFREQDVAELPVVYLSERHVENCKLVLNRSSLLNELVPSVERGVVAELGVNCGDFSCRIIETLNPSKLHLVDVWNSERYHDGLFKSVTTRFERLISEERVEIHRKLSVDASKDFSDNYFDLVYIDTDHTYSTTKRELLKYASKIKSKGVIAGHDYSMGNWIRSYRYGVIEAVHEFCVENNWELIFLTAEPLESQSFAIRRIG